MATPRFPNVDLSNFDLSKLPKFELPNIDLPAIDTDAITKVIKDVAYVTVGLAVLVVQKAQERRADFATTINEQFSSSKAQFSEAAAKFETQLSAVDARLSAIEAKIDGAVEDLEKRLPDAAGALLTQAHGATKAARKQVRDLLSTTAA